MSANSCLYVSDLQLTPVAAGRDSSGLAMLSSAEVVIEKRWDGWMDGGWVDG